MPNDSQLSPAVDFSRLPQPVLSGHPEWVELYHHTWQLAASHIRRMPQGRAYMDAAWDDTRNYQWVWDTCFMTLYCRYAADWFPGMASLDNFYDLQRADGYISMTYDLNTGQEVYGERINPPLFAWVEWEYYRTTGDASRLARVAVHIERLMDWIDANRRTQPHRRRTEPHQQQHEDSPDEGTTIGVAGEVELYQLYYFEDCGSSGMDDSPRTPRLESAGGFYDWIDLSSQMALSFRCLSLIHAAMGNAERAEYWANQAAGLGSLINDELWCKRTRFYHDRMLPANFVSAKTAAAFWPMLAGICPPARVEALVEHLRDEREFKRPVPVPTLSADDPNYSPEGIYWRGGVWAPTNYMITRGLVECGRDDVAHEIALEYLGVLQCTFETVEPHTLWECYSPEADLPGLAAYSHQRVKPHFVGWTGLGPTAMLIENVLGIEVDAPHARIEWTIRLTEEHGIRRLPIGPQQSVNLLCRERASSDATATVEARAEVPATLALKCGRRSQTIQLPANETITVTV